MKKIKTFIFALLTSVLLNFKAFAIWPDFTPAIPVAPQFCAQCIAADIPLALSYVEQAKAMKESYESYLDTSYWKQKFSSYVSRLGGAAFGALLKKAGQREKFLSYARSIKASKVANLANETDVQEVYIKLFFQYPSDKPSVMAEYEDMGKQFQMDSAIEAVVATKAMKEEVAKMREDLEKIEKCLMQGEGCSALGMQDCSATQGGEEDKEDNSCLWNNANTAILLYDKIMRYNENIVYMMSQYKAVQGIGGLAKIRPYGRKKKKKADLTGILPEQKSYAQVSGSVAFADQTMEDDSDLDNYLNDLATRDGVMLGDFDKSQPDTGFTTGLDGKEADIEAMKTLTELQDKINSAKSVHNIRQHLPEYRRIFKSYHNMEEHYNMAKKNFWQASECAINMLKNKYQNSVKAWFGKDCIIKDDNFGHLYCHYENKGAAPEDEGGTISYDVACPDNSNETCYVATFDNQGQRRGISGYLLDLYDTAKEQDATEEVESTIVVSNDANSSDSYVTKTNVELQGGDDSKNKGTLKDSSLYVSEKDESAGGYGSGGLVSLSSMNAGVGNKSNADVKASNLKDPSLADALNAQTRKEELLPWTIGKEVMGEVDRDLRSGQGKFAPVAHGFPIWNDQILFYDQYINGKYQDIVKYIKEEPFATETLELAEIINEVFEYAPLVLPSGVIAKTVEQVREGHAKEINEAKAYFANLDDRSAGVDELLYEQDAILDEKIKAQRNKIDSYYRQKDQLNQQLKTVNEKLSELIDEYNRANDDVTSSEVTTERAGEGQDYGEKLYAGRKVSQKSPQAESFSATKSSNAVVKETAMQTQQRVKADIASYEEQANALKNRLDELKTIINNERSKYVKEYSDAQIDQNQKLNQKIKSLAESSAAAIYKMRDYASTNPAINLAYKAVSCVREYAIARVNNASDNILGLSGSQSMYYAENAPLLQNIHQNMINEITDIKAEDLSDDCNVMAQFSEALAALEISDPMQPVYDIFKNLCQDGSCIKVDSEYYVSYLGRKRDFMAPKAAFEFASAPLREVFHFDVTDYGKIDKYIVDSNNLYSNKSVTITAQSFLESGLDIPEIWRHILARRSFVERSIDLEELFGKTKDKSIQRTADREFLRSGIYPCTLNGKYVDVIKGRHSSAYQYVNKVSGNFDSIGPCQEVVASGNRIVDRKSLAVPTFYFENTDDDTFSTKAVSELGTILGYISDTVDEPEIIPEASDIPDIPPRLKLTFNDALQNALQIINNNGELGKNPANDALFYMSQRAFLDRNQFGDYLNQYEILSVAQKSMQELETQMEEIRESILFAIEDSDFTLREDFDLTNKDDYENVKDILYQQKNVYMRSVQDGLNKIKANTSNLKEKVARVKHTLAILAKDAQTIVALSGKEDLDELEESIRNKQADSAVAEEYAGAEEESKQTEKELMPPYCAVY